MEAGFIRCAENWIAADPDPATRKQALKILESGNEEQLQDCFGTRLTFGTAGIRGVLGPGPGRMNRLLVRRVTWGMGKVLLERVPDVSRLGVIVAYDGRRLSPELAHDAASVLAGMGIPVHFLGGPHPTPLLAFGVRELGAGAGVMITASHNPPQYNGYKLYWQDGAQIVPPVDQEISDAIDRVALLGDIPWQDEEQARQQSLWRDVPTGLQHRYLRAIVDQLPGFEIPQVQDIGIVYTPLHGVGRRLLQQLFRERGFSQLRVVAEQAEPDGSFPTVEFPNPEEPGALDLALALCREQPTALLLANDPDADRLAVVLEPATSRQRVLTGDEIGCLLGDALLQLHREQGSLPPKPLVATTVVSSTWLGRIAKHYGARCERTLTGFKWIWHDSLKLESREGYSFVFGYEEALGYCAGPAVRDKDGISAALLFAELARMEAANGRTLLDRLQELERRFGLFRTHTFSQHHAGAGGIQHMAATMERMRKNPPGEIHGLPVLEMHDYQNASVRDLRTGQTRGIDLPPGNILALLLEDSTRVMLRPSGTEPKLKVYLEHCHTMRDGEDLSVVSHTVEQHLSSLEIALRNLLS
jgi:phosphomannomutase